VNHVCPSCGTALPEKVREAFCPVCTLQGALHLDPPISAVKLVGRIGDYELLEEIAHGGVGAVYKARQMSLGRVVALKLLLAGHFADPKARQRFRAEAEATARLRHPNVVTVFEVGEYEGQPFLAMEFIEGGTLASLVRDQPLPSLRAAACLARVARAIAHAHSQGIIHRDLKPSNVLLDRLDEPRVTDFGLAKQLGADTELTLTGQVLGSPSFMAPEQAAGRQDAIGPATDIYALGAILYQLVTGRPPFQGDSAATVIRQVQESEPIFVRRLNPGVPLDLETVILKCLEKEPTRRYRRADELADELERFVRGEPVRARPLSAVARGWRWCRRHPVRAGGIATVFLLLAAVAAISSVAALHIRRAQHEATAHLRQALLSEANAVRLGGRVGQRVQSLQALQALPLDGAPEELRARARNEAIAALALDDIKFVPRPHLFALDNASRGAFTADYSRYGYVRDGGAVVIARVDDGTEIQRLELGAASLGFFGGFSADHRFARLYGRRQTSVWDLETARECFRTNVSVVAVDFHPAKPLVAVAGRDGDIRFLELPSGRETARWPAPDGTQPGLFWNTIQFSPDGSLLAAARARTNWIDIFEAGSGRPVARWENTLPVMRMRWTRTGAYVAVAATNGSVNVWDARLNVRSWRFGEITPGVRDFAWSPDTSLLAAACIDHNVWVWDSPAARLVFKIPCNADEVEFSADGRRLGPVWQDGVTGWLETIRSEEFREWVSGTTETTLLRVDFSPDGRLLLTRSPTLARAHQTANGGLAVDFFGGTVFDAQFEPGAGHIWILHNGGLTRRRAGIIDETGAADKGPREEVLRGPDWRAMTFARDTTALALVRADQSVWLLDRSTTNLVPLLDATNRIRFAAFSPNGRWLATLDAPAQLRVWDAATREVLLTRAAPGVARLAFSPDNHWLATYENRVELIEAGTWRSGARISLPPNRPSGRALAFAPDSRSLVVTTDFADLQQFELPTGRALAIFQAPSRARVNHLAFSPDGHHFAAACDKGKYQVWDLQRLRAALAGLGLD
jgi:WD40 repeat protein